MKSVVTLSRKYQVVIPRAARAARRHRHASRELF